MQFKTPDFQLDKFV